MMLRMTNKIIKQYHDGHTSDITYTFYPSFTLSHRPLNRRHKNIAPRNVSSMAIAIHTPRKP